jgi:lysophospholipase L1-like esterase
MPTKDSVTGGIALRMLMEPGSLGILTREQGNYPVSVGMTLYAKASRDLKIRIGKATATVGTSWSKIDLTWEALGTSADTRKLGWQWVLSVEGPIQERTWLILDRVGVENPQFSEPEKAFTNQADVLLSTVDIIYGAEHVEATREKLRKKEPLRILALGDSVTEGAQANRGNWDVKDVSPFLYAPVLGHMLQAATGSEVSVKGYGHGGWTAEKALTVVDAEIVGNAQAGDLVIIEFGANDLNWAKTPIATYKENMRKLIQRCKAKTDQIVLLGPTMFDALPPQADDIEKVMKALCAEESVAAVDLVKVFVHQGPEHGWAWLANSCHPDFSGHAVMAALIAPLFTEKHISYPFTWQTN